VTDKPFKKLERECARLLDGFRYPANTGGPIDVENQDVVAQCKLVQELSLAELTRLVVAIETVAKTRGKRGVVFVKLRAGRGHETPLLAVVDASRWMQE
jgi:hypothetical protein